LITPALLPSPLPVRVGDVLCSFSGLAASFPLREGRVEVGFWSSFDELELSVVIFCCFFFGVCIFWGTLSLLSSSLGSSDGFQFTSCVSPVSRRPDLFSDYRRFVQPTPGVPLPVLFVGICSPRYDWFLYLQSI